MELSSDGHFDSDDDDDDDDNDDDNGGVLKKEEARPSLTSGQLRYSSILHTDVSSMSRKRVMWRTLFSLSLTHSY
ncbi:E3 ubiquitin-protein ligase RNF34-like [Sparus aurata]|uniref:E3 ubiquitin-protein ligase RNF34-like n=1 Tax=Sparus aurata TaxID=8175 RepID=UPI0011C164D2|nr:E3 ubiquitin-protein ligase RNF34-like [Sparus aurata]